MVRTATRHKKENSGANSPLFRANPAQRNSHKACLTPSAESANLTHATTSAASLSIEEDGHASLGTRDELQRMISLPRYLRPPLFREISPAAVSALDPVLKGIPIEYLQDHLKVKGERLLTTTTKISGKYPKDRVPQELEIVMNDNSPAIPSHIFAVGSNRSACKSNHVTLHPVHALVFAVHCSYLPILPYSEAQVDSGKVTLPVFPLSLPSPRTFHLIEAFLYTHRTQDLFSAFLPIPQGDLSPQDYRQKIADTCSVSTMLLFTSTIHSFWSNVTALGVFDARLWQVIEDSWAILLDAFSAKTGHRWYPQ